MIPGRDPCGPRRLFHGDRPAGKFNGRNAGEVAEWLKAAVC